MGNRQFYPAMLVPPGLLSTAAWLLGQGLPRHTLDNWVKSGQLVAVSRGVYKRPDTELTWQGVVCSLQRMGLELFPGGNTALSIQGMAHYISPRSSQTINLYGQGALPHWLNHILPGATFVKHHALAFNTDVANETRFVQWRTAVAPFGEEKWAFHISSPELAMLEVLMDVPESVSFEHALNLLQGLPTLSPGRLMSLLECCQSVKVKRLFLWLAEKSQSPWLKRLDLHRLSIEAGTLGAGKRVIAKSGKFDAKYQITVPAHLVGASFG